MPLRPRLAAAALATALVSLSASALPADAITRADLQYTQLLSRNMSGGIPNGPSGNSVISGDKRYARVIAFESEASDLVPGDTNGHKDVFAVLRGGSFGGDGTDWVHGETLLMSRTHDGSPANGPSFSPSIDGQFHRAETREPNCVGFLSAASNLVPGDTDGRVDAFLTKISGGAPKRVSPDVDAEVTAIAVSGNCSRVAMVAGGNLYVYRRGVTQLIATGAVASDPQFSVGRNQDLVFGTPAGVMLLEAGKTTPKLVAAGGRNPAYNDIKRQVVAYEKSDGTYTQVMFRDLGEKEQVASARKGVFGDGDSRDPVIGNSGYALAFETNATNLGVNALSRAGDDNQATDVYLYTDVRHLTLLQSTEEKAVPMPGGGRNPGMNFYNNYITFDSPAPLGASSGNDQVWMRYLGGETVGAGGISNLPPPGIGQSMNVVAESGTVRVKLPPGTTKRAAKQLGLQGAQSGFVPLDQAKQLPMGSTFDTTRGRLGLYTSTKNGRALQDAHLRGAQFTVTQGRKNPLTTMAMRGGGLSGCNSAVPRGGARKSTDGAVSTSRRRRRLFSNVHGRYRSRGRTSTATVRGTQWTMTDTCKGTLTSVKSGAVVVHDLRKGKRKLLRKGQRYFAAARGLRGGKGRRSPR